MGFRFYRRVKILPGITLNFSKSGVSTSVGVRGAKLTFGKNGRRATVGLPGTGISYTAYQKKKRGGKPVVANCLEKVENPKESASVIPSSAIKDTWMDETENEKVCSGTDLMEKPLLLTETQKKKSAEKFIFACPLCKTQYYYEEEMEGEELICASCGHHFLLNPSPLFLDAPFKKSKRPVFTCPTCGKAFYYDKRMEGEELVCDRCNCHFYYDLQTGKVRMGNPCSGQWIITVIFCVVGAAIGAALAFWGPSGYINSIVTILLVFLIIYGFYRILFSVLFR